MNEQAVVICSGGMDSTALAYRVEDEYFTPHLVSFDYGQRHSKELGFARRTASQEGWRHTIVDVSHLASLLAEGGSALISGTEVPEGHYAQENMKATVVPNRNMIMLSIAGGIAVATDAVAVYTGVHAGDHFIYPDCRPTFIEAASKALGFGNSGFGNLSNEAIRAPYIDLRKSDIALELIKYGVPFAQTWSCYKGGDKHCGKCGTCVERLEAIHWARMNYSTMYGQQAPEDTTEYEDSNFWKEAVSAHQA